MAMSYSDKMKLARADLAATGSRVRAHTLEAENAQLRARIAELEEMLETTASALSHATDLIEKHVPIDALGTDSSGDLSEAHLTWSWPVLDEHIHGLQQTVTRARALLDGKVKK